MIRVVPKVNYCRASVQGPGTVWAWVLTVFGFLAHVLYACASGIAQGWEGHGRGGGGGGGGSVGTRCAVW